MLPEATAVVCMAVVYTAVFYNDPLCRLPRCRTQNGYCLAMALSRLNVSSSGGSSRRSSSFSFFDRGCLTILAVGRTVKGEFVAVVTEMTLGFIRDEVLKVMNGLN